MEKNDDINKVLINHNRLIKLMEKLNDFIEDEKLSLLEAEYLLKEHLNYLLTKKKAVAHGVFDEEDKKKNSGGVS